MTIYIPMIILTVFLADIQERIRYRGRKISISLSIALMTAFVPLINRVLYYGMAYELLYLPNMLKLINNRREKMLVKVFLILMYGGITAYGMINSGWYTCIPYNFYFDYR